MGRPPNADGDVTARRILECAIERFAEQGFHAVSTRELAVAAHVNPAMLAYYFKSKRGLLDAAIVEAQARIARGLHKVIAAPMTANMLAQLATGTATLDQIDLPAFCAAAYGAMRSEATAVRLLSRVAIDEGAIEEPVRAVSLAEEDQWTDILARVCRVTTARARTCVVILGYLVSRLVMQSESSLVTQLRVEDVAASHHQIATAMSDTIRAQLRAST